MTPSHKRCVQIRKTSILPWYGEQDGQRTFFKVDGYLARFKERCKKNNENIGNYIQQMPRCDSEFYYVSSLAIFLFWATFYLFWLYFMYFGPNLINISYFTAKLN